MCGYANQAKIHCNNFDARCHMQMKMAAHSWLSSMLFCIGFVLGFCLSYMGISLVREHLYNQLRLPRFPWSNTLAVINPSSVRLQCWVMTSPETLWSRAIHVHNTWGRLCDTLLFVSSAPDPDFPGTLHLLRASKGRRDLSHKTRAVFTTLHDRYLQQTDWLLKADDTTYVMVDNLRLLLSGLQPDRPIYMGWQSPGFAQWDHTKGETGFVLSREAARRYVGALRELACGRRLGVGQCLEKLAVLAGDSDHPPENKTFSMQWLETQLCSADTLPQWLPGYSTYPCKVALQCCAEVSVSLHCVDLDRMYGLEYNHLFPNRTL